MRLSTATGAVVAVLRRPADLLPFYLLGAAVPAIARLVLFAGLALAYLYLDATGRLAEASEVLAGVDPSPPDPADPEAVAEWNEAVEPALELLYPPAVAAIVVVAALLTLVAIGVLSVVVSAGQVAACDGRLRGERGLVAGIDGVRRYWRRFLGLAVLELLLWGAATAALLAVVVAAAVVGVAGGLAPNTTTPLVALVAGSPWLLFVAVVRAVFALAPVAVVVDDAGLLASLRASVGFVRRRPIEAGFYYAVAVGATLAVSTLAGVLAFVGAGILVSLVLAIALPPVLDLLKTALYAGYRDALSPPAPVDATVRRQVADGLRRGARELLAFVGETPGYHLLAVGTMAAGFAMGWVAVDPLVGVTETSIENRLVDHVPPRATLVFFGNNWNVALVTTYAGVALAAPALVSLWFNGLALGAIGRLEVDPLALLAFVTPHGVLEIPAILVSGAAGVFLGVAWWRTLRGRAGRAALADALERAFWVVVGTGILLAVAAVIEGFVSPYYFRPFV